MNRTVTIVVMMAAFTSLSARFALTTEPVTGKNVVPPKPNRADEPLAKAFSIRQAVHFLDSASLDWQAKRGCMTCHTNYAYLYARPSVSDEAAAHREVRRFAESLVNERWPTKGPRWDAEVVATAAALAFNDAATTGKLHETTRVALDRMWTVQRDDGGWSWLKCGWPPMESDDHYGVVLAAIAVGVAPDNYAQSDAAQKGLAGIRRYLKENATETLHQRAMLLWAVSYLDDLVSDQEREQTVNQIITLQQEDGGWALASLGQWQRADGKEQDVKTSDGYATGFAVYVLRRSGVSASDPVLRRGVAWLKANQRSSGRWFTRSLNNDSRHYISHAGTAMAVMALAECESLE